MYPCAGDIPRDRDDGIETEVEGEERDGRDIKTVTTIE